MCQLSEFELAQIVILFHFIVMFKIVHNFDLFSDESYLNTLGGIMVDKLMTSTLTPSPTNWTIAQRFTNGP